MALGSRFAVTHGQAFYFKSSQLLPSFRASALFLSHVVFVKIYIPQTVRPGVFPWASGSRLALGTILVTRHCIAAELGRIGLGKGRVME